MMKRSRKQVVFEDAPFDDGKAEKEEEPKKKAKEEKKSDDEDDGDEAQEVQVDFEFYNPSDIDYLSVKNYCRALLANVAGNLDLAPVLAQAILDADVGSVVKCEGYTDALAVITVLPLWGDKAAPEWAGPFLAAAGVEHKDAKGLGLLVNLRIANMPVVKLAPAMHGCVFGEVAKRPKSAPKYTRYLVVAPYYLESEIDDDDDEGEDESDEDEGARKAKKSKKTKAAKKAKKASSSGGSEKVYVRPEEELYVAAADALRELTPSSLSASADVHSLLVPKHAQAATVAASKVPSILQQMQIEFMA